MSPLQRIMFFSLIFLIGTLSLSVSIFADEPTISEEIVETPQADLPSQKVIDLDSFNNKKIIEIKVEGNNTVSLQAILTRCPYRIGGVFKRQKTRQLINTLYDLGYFSTIALEVEETVPEKITLIIKVKEKPTITGFVFEGNKHLSKEELQKKLKYKDVKALDPEELYSFAENIKKLYVEKDYHHAQVESQLRMLDNNSAEAVFSITEGSQTHVRRVFFKGNDHVSRKLLSSIIFTREDWLLGFMNRAGSYQKDALEYDKSVIENYYQSNGFLAARVTKVDVQENDKTHKVDVTFEIDEGELYTVAKVNAPDNKLLSEQEILRFIPIRPGMLYSREMIKNTIEILRTVWGDYGYIYADIDPSVVPDEEKKTVDITFYSTLGNPFTLNKITLIGNKKTRDKIIRREILFDEGELLTTRKLEMSKGRIQALGFFNQQTGVNWKITKLDDSRADLELLLEEIKTGQLYFQMGFGGVAADKASPSDSFRISGGAYDTNFLGKNIQGTINASYSRQDRSVDFSLANPWLFDRPLYGAVTFVNRKSNYEDFRGANATPQESTLGGSGRLGYSISQYYNINAISEIGYQKIDYNKLFSDIPGFTPVLQQRFHSGKLLEVITNFVHDRRNHPINPTQGYIWNINAKVGVPHGCNTFGFFKTELDAQWYTSLIEEYSLVLRVHGFFGYLKQINNNILPYRELFHIGGPATVRGFLFGQIGPTYVDQRLGINDSLGGTKAMVVNVELLFPIKADNTIRGTLFYDGGAGWDTPNKGAVPGEPLISPLNLRNNKFSYRHAIGFGVRLTQPTPIRLDVGFKLDRKKRLGESMSEVHFSMARDF